MKQANTRLAKALGEQKHFNHAFTDEFRKMFLEEAGFDLWDMPICPHCEGLARWDKGGAAFCKRCGPISPPIMTFGKFYELGYNTDRTVHPNAPMVVDREVVSPDQVVTVYGGEAGLSDKDKAIKVVIPDNKTAGG